MWRKAGMSIVLAGVMCSIMLPSAFAQGDGLKRELLDAKSKEEYRADVEKLSPQERRDNAVKGINGMKSAEKSVQGMREEELQNGQEIAKINCINDKLSLIKGHVNISEKAYLAMDEGEQKGDISSVTHHYTLIAISDEKVSRLSDEAGLCLGRQNNLGGESLTEVIVGPDVVDVDAVLPGGYTNLIDIFGDIYDTVGLTPLR